MHGPAEWVVITDDDIFRPEFEIGVDPEVEENDVHFIHDLADMFNASIGGRVYATLGALSRRWGESKGTVVELLSNISHFTGVIVLIRWADEAVRITWLGIPLAWGVFGSQPHADA